MLTIGGCVGLSDLNSRFLEIEPHFVMGFTVMSVRATFHPWDEVSGRVKMYVRLCLVITMHHFFF